MSMTRMICAVLMLGASSALADAASLLDKAEAAVRDLEYSEALKSIEAARKEPNNSRATMLRLYELQSLTLATLGQEAKALKAFQALLSLDPDFKLKGKQPPRVTTVFFEARSWIDQNKGLAVRAAGPVFAPGVVKEVKVEITNDPLKLIKEVRFHFMLDGKPKDLDVAVNGVTVTGPVGAPKLTWWAEALTERDAVLATIGDSAAPTSVVAPDAPRAVATKPDLKPQPKVEPTPAVEPVKPADKPTDEPAIDAWAEAPSKPATPMAPLRIVGISLGAGAVVAAGIGVLFGAMANGTAAQITGAERDASGRIVSITRTQALDLDAQQRSQATVANILFVSSGVLLAGGVTLFLLGGEGSPAQVALVPAPGGVGLVGTFR